MNKNTIYRYLGRYLATVLKVPFKNRQGKLMFYGDTNDRLRLKNVISDKNLKRYSNSIAARICLKHILDNYFIAVRPHSELESGYKQASLQSPKAVNKKMVDSQMERKAVTIRRGNHTETFNLPPLPTNHRRHYTKKLEATNERQSKKIAQLEAKLRAKNAQSNPDSNASGVSSDTDGDAKSTNPVSSNTNKDFSPASSDGDDQSSSENTVDENSNNEKPIQLSDSYEANDGDNEPSSADDEPGHDNNTSSNSDSNDEEQRDPKSEDNGFANGSWRE